MLLLHCQYISIVTDFQCELSQFLCGDEEGGGGRGVWSWGAQMEGSKWIGPDTVNLTLKGTSEKESDTIFFS